jgi:hypothetical protein
VNRYINTPYKNKVAYLRWSAADRETVRLAKKGIFLPAELEVFQRSSSGVYHVNRYMVDIQTAVGVVILLCWLIYRLKMIQNKVQYAI